MRIGQIAALAGVSTDTLRFYEARGLIRSARGANGYRDYPEGTAGLVTYIRTAQRLGFSLAEIGEHLPALWGATEPDAAVAALLREKIAAIDGRIAELSALRDELALRLGNGCPLRAQAADKPAATQMTFETSPS